MGFDNDNFHYEDELNTEEMRNLDLLLHNIVSASVFPKNDIIGINTLIVTRPCAFEFLACEFSFIERVMKYVQSEDDIGNLLCAMELTATLTNSYEITDVLIDKGILTVLCSFLVESDYDRLKIIAMRCLHHIASQSKANCLLQFEEIRISLKDDSKYGSPIQCVMYVIDEQIGGKQYSQFYEMQNYIKEGSNVEESLIDQDNIKLRKLSLKFLVALVCSKNVPSCSLLAEIVEFIVKSTFEKNQELLIIALYGCDDCVNNYFKYFWSPFSKYCCFSNFINMIQDQYMYSRIKAIILLIFLSILENNSNEVDDFANNNFIQVIQDYMISIQNEENDSIKVIWCKIVFRFLEIQFEDNTVEKFENDFVNIFFETKTFDTIYQYLLEGTVDLKIYALPIFQILFESFDITSKLNLLDKYPDLLLAITELLQCNISNEENLICLFKMLGDMIDFYNANDQSLLESVLNDDEIIRQIDFYIENHPLKISIRAKQLRNKILNDHN